MTSLDLTSFDFALKQHYTDERVELAMYKNNPLLALLPKDENFGGSVLPVPLTYVNPMGRSATFATAQSNATASKGVKFLLTRKKDYAVATIDNETILASQKDADSFLKAAVHEIDGALHNLKRSAAIAAYRDGKGTIGQINATVTGTTLTLVNAEDITNFEVGMKIQFSSAGTSATLRDSGEALTVSAIDRDAGSMTVSANLNTIASIAENDYINVEGDIEGKISGLQAWLVYGGASATSFYGVDRSVDKFRLGGCWYDGSALPIEEALITSAMRLGREGAEPDYCFMNFNAFGNLEKALGSKVQYIDVKAGTTGQIGFKGIQIAAGGVGPITVLADQNCPSNYAFMLMMKHWTLYSLGKLPQPLDTDGLQMLRQYTSDGVEVRYGYYANLACSLPGHNLVLKLS